MTSLQQGLALAGQWGVEQIGSELEAFCEWLTERPIHHVVEIGVRRGGTVALWHTLSTGLVIGIDIETGLDVPFGFTVERHRELSADFPRFRSVIGDSHDAMTVQRVRNLLGHEQASLVFIDGDHSAEGVEQDRQMYSQFLAPGSVLAFHDIVDTPFTRSVNCCVSEVWKRVGGAKREFVQGEAQWGGIGAVRM